VTTTWFFRAALRLDALAVCRGRLVDRLRDGGAADERDALDIVVFEKSVHRVDASVDELDDAVGEARGVEQVEEILGGQRRLLAGLEHERVARRGGVRQEPQRDHPGEVERRHGGEDAERLSDGGLVDTGSRVLDVPGLHERGDPTGRLDVLDATPELARCLPERLSVLLDEQFGELCLVLLEQPLELEQRLDALLDGTTAPVLEGSPCGRDGLVDVGRGAEPDARDGRPGRGVGDVLSVGRGGRPLAVDVVLDAAVL
jgi:hypothetical protein